jgi:hypothetical protein
VSNQNFSNMSENTKPAGRAGNPEGGPVRVQLTIPEDLNAEIVAYQKAQKDIRCAAPDSKPTIILDALRTYLAQLPWTAPEGPPPTFLSLLVLALASGCDRGAISGLVSLAFVAAGVYAVGHLLLSLLEKQQDDETTY